jgi:hypothetical protein
VFLHGAQKQPPETITKDAVKVLASPGAPRGNSKVVAHIRWWIWMRGLSDRDIETVQIETLGKNVSISSRPIAALAGAFVRSSAPRGEPISKLKLDYLYCDGS